MRSSLTTKPARDGASPSPHGPKTNSSHCSGLRATKIQERHCSPYLRHQGSGETQPTRGYSTSGPELTSAIEQGRSRQPSHAGTLSGADDSADQRKAAITARGPRTRWSSTDAWSPEQLVQYQLVKARALAQCREFAVLEHVVQIGEFVPRRARPVMLIAELLQRHPLHRLLHGTTVTASRLQR